MSCSIPDRTRRRQGQARLSSRGYSNGHAAACALCCGNALVARTSLVEPLLTRGASFFVKWATSYSSPSRCGFLRSWACRQREATTLGGLRLRATGRAKRIVKAGLDAPTCTVGVGLHRYPQIPCRSRPEVRVLEQNKMSVLPRPTQPAKILQIFTFPYRPLPVGAGTVSALASRLHKTKYRTPV